jgi:hypothetical protein
MYLLTIILYFVLLYGIFSTVATKVKLFGRNSTRMQRLSSQLSQAYRRLGSLGCRPRQT